MGESTSHAVIIQGLFRACENVISDRRKCISGVPCLVEMVAGHHVDGLCVAALRFIGSISRHGKEEGFLVGVTYRTVDLVDESWSFNGRYLLRRFQTH